MDKNKKINKQTNKLCMVIDITKRDDIDDDDEMISLTIFEL